MKYLSIDPIAMNCQEKIFGNKACESVEPTDLQYQVKKSKRYRSAFTTGQINYLENQFKKCPYIGNAGRKEVASVLNISERAIKIWFQNRRMKEKKEAIRKEEEYHLDRQNNSINNVTFTNDSLNNVHSSQSTNDIQCSLQTAISHIKGKIDCMSHDDEIYGNKSNSYVMNFEKSKRGISEYIKSYNFNENDIIKNKKIINKVHSQKRRNLSESNLNKKNNNTNFITNLEKNSNDVEIKSKAIPKISNKNVRGFMHSAAKTEHQDLPEDLSANKKSNATVQQNHQENMSYNTAYIPFCSKQNYYTPCVSAGNVIWKPVNVMPIMPNGLPTTTPQRQYSEIHQVQAQHINCSCKCHMKNSMNFEEGTKIFQPQYIIAIPFHNYSNQ